MGLLDKPTKDAAQVAADQIISLCEGGLKLIAELQSRGIDLFWNNKIATPEQIAAKLGPRAAAAFEAHGVLTMTRIQLGQIAEEEKPFVPALPKFAFAANLDGTVTIDSGKSYIP